jgi:hypothetical protein
MGDLAHRLEALDPARRFELFPGGLSLDGRQPVVLAHGPSLRALLPSLIARRDRLYVVAPLRTALHLADGGLCPDVVVHADAAAWTCDLSLQAWGSASAGARRALEEKATLVTQPFVPTAIHQGFRRACVFDDGLGWLAEESTLPFWGSALLPSICLALALGARKIAVGGMDMGASCGRRSRTWRGARMFLDPKLEVAHGLLEALAATWPGRFVDLSPDSIVKRGFVQIDLNAWLVEPARAGASAGPQSGGRTICIADALRHVAEKAGAFTGAVGQMTAVASRVCALSAAGEEAGAELKGLLTQMEQQWAEDSTCRNVLSLLQPPYLWSFWQLRAAGFTPRNPERSMRMKAKLIGPEIADLEKTYSTWLAMLREAARAVSTENEPAEALAHTA